MTSSCLRRDAMSQTTRSHLRQDVTSQMTRRGCRQQAGDILYGQHSSDTDDTGDACAQLDSHPTSVPWSDSSVHLACLQCHALIVCIICIV